MNDERKLLWMTTLLSGDFKQGTGRLRDRDRFCPLGVACEIYREVTDKGSWENGWFTVDGESSMVALPRKVRDWFGLININPRLKDDTSLTDLNDYYGKSFYEIAKLIDENL